MDKEVKELINIMGELVSKSEARVDRTNEIISKAYIIIDKITSEYTKQIEKMQEARDRLVLQNTDLIRMNEGLSKELEKLHEKYDNLFEKVLNFMSKGSSENNINIK